MARTSLQLVNQAAMGFSVAFLLAPLAISFPANAQTARTAQQPLRTDIVQQPVSMPPAGTLIIRTNGEEPQPTDNAGSCSGVSDCNNFIAICIGGGGTYVPGSTNGQGQPTSGSCDVD